MMPHGSERKTPCYLMLTCKMNLVMQLRDLSGQETASFHSAALNDPLITIIEEKIYMETHVTECLAARNATSTAA